VPHDVLDLDEGIVHQHARARQLRRNSQTTATARIEPSMSALSEAVRETWATSGMASNRLVTVLSMNQLSSSGVRVVVVTA
jgi:hypothetical protein